MNLLDAVRFKAKAKRVTAVGADLLAAAGLSAAKMIMSIADAIDNTEQIKHKRLLDKAFSKIQNNVVHRLNDKKEQQIIDKAERSALEKLGDYLVRKLFKSGLRLVTRALFRGVSFAVRVGLRAVGIVGRVAFQIARFLFTGPVGWAVLGAGAIAAGAYAAYQYNKRQEEEIRDERIEEKVRRMEAEEKELESVTPPAKSVSEEVPAPKPEAAKPEVVKEVPAPKPEVAKPPTKERTTLLEKGKALLYGSSNKKLVVEALVANGIDDPVAIANILSQVKHESNFVPRSEDTGWKAATMLRLWPKKFKSPEEAEELYKKGPKASANFIYGTNKMLGNNQPDDGYNFRGRGFIQITGRDAYTAASKSLGVDLVANPDLANTPEVAAKIIPWFFLKYKRKSVADLKDIAKVSAAVGFQDDAAKSKAAARARTAENLYAEAVKAAPSIKDSSDKLYVKNGNVISALAL